MKIVNLKEIQMKKGQKSNVNCQMFYAKKMRKAGFSLVEVLVAMFVFVLVMTMLSGSFAGFLKNYANTKKSQKSVENAQFVMNQMEQVFLSSSHVAIGAVVPSGANAGDFRLDFYNTMNNNCVVYYFDSSAKSVFLGSVASADANTCDFPNISHNNALISGSVVGFSAIGDPVKITLVFKIQEPGQREETTIQSTALSRNAWINDPACPVTVLASDSSVSQWGPRPSSCPALFCGTDSKLLADNKLDFSSGGFDARVACQILGGRLPDVSELICLLSNKDSYGGSLSFTSNVRYWTSEEVDQNKAYVVRNDATPTSENTNQKNQNERVRCVK